MTVTTWLENIALPRSSGTYLRYCDKIAKPDVLILDDMEMRKLSSTEAQDLCEILEKSWKSVRSENPWCSLHSSHGLTGQKSSVTPSSPSRSGIEHAPLTIQITGEGYRGVKARKLASKKKDR